MKRDLVCKTCLVIVSLKLKSTRNFPLRISMQSKNNNNGKMQMTSYCYCFIFVQKYNIYLIYANISLEKLRKR